MSRLKQFDFAFRKRTWRHVYRAVSNATTLFIIGYSLPREDQFARLVFRRAIRNNVLKARKRKAQPAKVVVVNPDAATEATFSHLAGRDIADFDFRQTRFEDYAAAQ